MAELKDGEKIALSGEGWDFILHEESSSARFHLDQNAFEHPVKEDDCVWLTRKSDQQKFLIYENNIMEVMQNMPLAPNALFVEPGDENEPYLFMKSIINDSMFLFHKGQFLLLQGSPLHGR